MHDQMARFDDGQVEGNPANKHREYQKLVVG